MITIVQARTNSKRFPRKILYKIYGKTIIEHVISNIKKSRNVSQVIVATSKETTDNELVKFLKNKKIKFYRGDLENVALRCCKIAKKLKIKNFIRINADSPLIDHNLIDHAIEIYKKNINKFDIITNVFPRTFPSGQSVEIIKTSLLEKNIHKMNKYELEHVTPYFYLNNKSFKIINFIMKKKKIKLKFSIDTKNDLKLIKQKINKKKFFNFKII